MAVSSRDVFLRAKMVGMKESFRLDSDVSLGKSVEYRELPEELWALLSRLALPDLLDLARR
jgi:hypothetical protein